MSLEDIKARAAEVEDGTKQHTIGQAFMVASRSQADVPKLVAALEAVQALCDASTKLAGDTHRPFVMAESVRIAIKEYLR